MNVKPLGSLVEPMRIRSYVQKNFVARVAHERQTQYLEKERNNFVRQHSREEQEVKKVLERLHSTQDALREKPSMKCSSDEETAQEIEDEDVFVNPYPITIVPQRWETKGKGPTKGRRASLGSNGSSSSLLSTKSSDSGHSPFRTTGLRRSSSDVQHKKLYRSTSEFSHLKPEVGANKFDTLLEDDVSSHVTTRVRPKLGKKPRSFSCCQ